LAERAAREGVSINQLITVAVTSTLSAAEAEARFLPHLSRMEAAIDQLVQRGVVRQFGGLVADPSLARRSGLFDPGIAQGAAVSRRSATSIAVGGLQ
jgi:hypothetical protein